MNFKPPNFKWFLPFLKKLKFFKDVEEEELFNYSTEEIFEKIKQGYPSTWINLLLAERFFLENLEGNVYSKRLLELILEEQEIRGFLIELEKKVIKHSKDLAFIELGEKKFFFPMDWNNFKRFLKDLWKGNHSFSCVEVEFKAKEDLKEVNKYLELCKIFDFSYLSEKALNKLKTFLPTLDLKVLKEFNSKFLTTSSGFLALMSLTPDRFQELKEKINKSQIFLNSDGKSLFLGKSYQDMEMIKEFQDLMNKSGILTRDRWEKYKTEGATPLIYVIGALEHAKRLNDIKVVLFEGFTYHVIGDLFYEWGDLGKALKYYSLAKDHTKQPIELALSESAIYYNLGDLDRAEKILKAKLCGCVKEDPMVHHNIGLIYFKKGNIERAKFHFYKAVLLDPENTIFRESLIKFLWDIKAYDELEEFLSSVENLSDKEEIFLGKLHFYKKDYERAFEYLKRVFTCPDKDGETLLFLAWLYLYFNKEKEVSEILLKEAKGVLNKEDFDKIVKELGLD